MDNHEKSSSRRIYLLREDVSRKIAAGEVIDRPFSVVRELLDNAIDADAQSIELSIQGGGISAIQVVDDGRGMGEEDLGLCYQRHATSKIREEQDLYRVSSLGFRGEALASIAACARLEIRSLDRSSEHAHCLVVEGGKVLSLGDCAGTSGTRVEVSDLFFNMPVRRKFLKSPAAEANRCRQTLLEKALPHPEIAFRFMVNGKLSSYFPGQPLLERVCSAFGLEQAHFQLLEGEDHGFTMTLVAARPELSRRDRSLIQIFVNRRRIFEYSLIQAAQYAYSQYMPGGSFPIVFAFLQVEPEMVDFNIHPAKREARFRNLPQLHQNMVAILKAFLQGFRIRVHPVERGRALDVAEALTTPGGKGGLDVAEAPATLGGDFTASQGLPFEAEGGSRPLGKASHPAPNSDQLAPGMEGDNGAPGAVEGPAVAVGKGAPAMVEGPAVPGAPAKTGTSVPNYRGQIFKLFLLAEYRDSLYIIDQHAAHERLLYEELINRPVSTQELLLPIRLEAAPQQEELITQRQELFRTLGIRLERYARGSYQITALPEDFLSLEEEKLLEILLAAGDPEALKEKLLSQVACRLAIKEGEVVDAHTALELIRSAFTLDNARCPHGRPLWHRISKGELFRYVGRGNIKREVE